MGGRRRKHLLRLRTPGPEAALAQGHLPAGGSNTLFSMAALDLALESGPGVPEVGDTHLGPGAQNPTVYGEEANWCRESFELNAKELTRGAHDLKLTKNGWQLIG